MDIGWIVLAILAAGRPTAAFGAVVSVPPTRAAWHRLESAFGRGEAPVAFARAAGGDLAVGEAGGVSWWRGAERMRAVLSGIRDLRFDSDGVLWIATDAGLFVWRRGDRPVRHTLRGGDAANRVRRLAIAPSGLLLATEGGAYWTHSGRIFQRLRPAGAARPTTRVALRVVPSGPRKGDGGGRAPIVEAWLFGADRLTRVRGIATASGLRVMDRRDLPMPRVAGGERLEDLVVGPRGERLFLVFEDGIAWRRFDQPAAGAGGARSSLSGGTPSPWRVERPGLPPGAVLRRLRWGADRVWLVTDHGLLEAETVAGPFRRTGNPVGTIDCLDLQTGPERRGAERRRVERRTESGGMQGQPIVLCRSGLFVRTERTEPEERPPEPRALHGPSIVLSDPDPPLAEIRRRALERAGLTVARAEGMWRRLRRRAYWPEIDLSLDLDFESELERDRDQAFVSGDTRRLFDRTKDEGRRYRAGVRFGWDLGEAVYPNETVDLSRELRQIISLRDDVLDEINQLYFERQRIREQLSASPSLSPAEASQLRWRARELDAGLDAWTGGWVHRWRRAKGPGAAADRRPFDSEDLSKDIPGPVFHPTTEDGREIHR